MDLANQTTTVLYGPNNEPLQELPTTLLTSEEALLLRTYKKFLSTHGLREALYCSSCWDQTRDDGCKAFVTDAQIAIVCRCRTRFHQGQSF